jgi:predicted permease
MDALLIDLRYALRGLLRRPALPALAVLTLAIGVGVNTVAFSAVNGLLYHPFAFTGVDRLGWVMLKSRGNPDGDLSWNQFSDLRRSTTAFDAVAAAAPVTLALHTASGTEQMFASAVSPQFFDAVGARAESGRTWTADDLDTAAIPGVVSHRFWTNHLGGSSIAGRTLKIGSALVSIVGVMPDDFQGPTGLYAPDIWLPLERLDALGAAAAIRDRDNEVLAVFARLAPGANVTRAQTELAADAQRWNAAAPRTDPIAAARPATVRFYPMQDGHPEVQQIAPYAWVTMAIVALVLMLACFNVGALLLTRAAERRREIGVRVALGAGRGRLVRGLLIEGLLLAIVSGAAALVLAAWSERLLAVFALPAPVPQRLHMDIDGRLIGFTALMVLLAGVVPALFPALQATKRGIVRSLHVDAGFGAGRPSKARNALVVAQIAGSTLFLAIALLCVRSFLSAAAFNPGFEVDRTVVASLDPMQYGVDAPRTRALLDALLQRLEASPAIASVAAADRVPFSVGYPHAEITATPGEDCSGSRCRPVLTYSVSPRHFTALGVPLVGGRDLTDADMRTGTSVIVNEALAAARWPHAQAIGQTLLIGKPARAVTVVGVAANIRYLNLSEPPRPVLYTPLTDGDFEHGMTIIARAAGDPRAAIVALRDTMRSVSPDVPPGSLDTMREHLALPLWPYRTGAGFFLVCGTLALVLATVGLFGATYFAVRQRTREFGIRIAIGARRSDVIRQVLGEGVRLSVIGAIAGLGAAAIAGRLLARLLIGVTPADPLSFGAAAAIQIAVAVAACLLPARRATQADPVASLRDGV